MRILGVQDGINASACLLEDGALRRAIQEERLSGTKEHIGFPFLSVRRILEVEGLTIDQIDEMALATNYYTVSPGVGGHTKSMSVHQKLKDLAPAFFGVYEDNVPRLKARAPELFSLFERRRNVARLGRIREGTSFYGPVTIVDHHIAHAASGFYSAPWRDEPVLVMSKDASGDGLCATVNVGENGTFRRIAQTVHTHSLGYLYTAVTGFMGMKQHSHEYKVMGLAPHAPERYARAPYDTFLSYIGLGRNSLEFRRKVPEPLHHIKPRMRRDLFMQRFDGIAAGLQRLTEELMVTWTKNAIRRTGIRKVTGAGGVYMNVKANMLIRQLPEVEGFFPMPSAGDETTSIGAAQWVYAQRMLEAGQEPRLEPLGPLYLGDEPTEKEIETGLTTRELGNVDVVHTRHADDLIADLILRGHIVARCRGPMEFGARALGNRSILCDARRLENVGLINRAIKSRDFWMPFAPVVTATQDFPDHYFAAREPAPYMAMAFGTTPMARRDLRAALHQADFTARPQILEPSWNPGYHSVLERFRDETGCGGMLNTSFNLHGKPIVHGPREAMDTFLNSGLEYLALGDYLLVKK